MLIIPVSYVLQSGIVSLLSSGIAMYWLYNLNGSLNYQFIVFSIYIGISWYFIEQVKRRINSIDETNRLFLETLNAKYEDKFKVIRGSLEDVLKVIAKEDRYLMFIKFSEAVSLRKLYIFHLLIYLITIGASISVMFFQGGSYE